MRSACTQISIYWRISHVYNVAAVAKVGLFAVAAYALSVKHNVITTIYHDTLSWGTRRDEVGDGHVSPMTHAIQMGAGSSETEMMESEHRKRWVSCGRYYLKILRHVGYDPFVLHSQHKTQIPPDVTSPARQRRSRIALVQWSEGRG